MERVIQTIGGIASLGALVGLGQLLMSDDKLTFRLVIGRALTSAGIAASAASILVWLPNVPLVALCGLAALMASLGTSGLERLLQKYMGK